MTSIPTPTQMAVSATLKLGHATLTLFGVKRHAGARGLKALERANLVSVTRRTGRSPETTLLPTSSPVDTAEIQHNPGGQHA